LGKFVTVQLSHQAHGEEPFWEGFWEDEREFALERQRPQRFPSEAMYFGGEEEVLALSPLHL
jgi:hypothetical protein